MSVQYLCSAAFGARGVHIPRRAVIFLNRTRNKTPIANASTIPSSVRKHHKAPLLRFRSVRIVQCVHLGVDFCCQRRKLGTTHFPPSRFISISTITRRVYGATYVPTRRFVAAIAENQLLLTSRQHGLSQFERQRWNTTRELTTRNLS